MLYLRYLLAYLRSKTHPTYRSVCPPSAAIDTSFPAWSVETGKYFDKATLLSLVRNITGHELPKPLYQDVVFGSTAGDDDVADVVTNNEAFTHMGLAMGMRKLLAYDELVHKHADNH